jgi:hypothetical protein
MVVTAGEAQSRPAPFRSAGILPANYLKFEKRRQDAGATKAHNKRLRVP